MPSAESTRVPSRSNKSTDGRVRAGDGGGATSIQATGGGPPADRYPGNSALFFIDKTATSAAVTRWTVNGLASTVPPPLPLVVRGLWALASGGHHGTSRRPLSTSISEPSNSSLDSEHPRGTIGEVNDQIGAQIIVGKRTTDHILRRRVISVVIAAVVAVVGVTWFAVSHGSRVTVRSTISNCSWSISGQGTVSPSLFHPAIVGIGSNAGLAAYHIKGSRTWCFTGMGTGTAPISLPTLRAPVSSPIAILDGDQLGESPAVLLLVHRGPGTASVLAVTEWTRSTVIAKGSGFEVLRLPIARWPSWHTPWLRNQVTLGTLMGFDRAGRVTFGEPFGWCPGQISTILGHGC